MLETLSEKKVPRSHIGGKSDLSLSDYFYLTTGYNKVFARQSIRKKLGQYRRFLTICWKTIADMVAEFIFYLRNAQLAKHPDGKLAMSFLRKRAHVIEKSLMNLHAGTRDNERRELVAKSRHMLKEIEKCLPSLNDNTLPWVLRLLKEEEWSIKNGWCCDKLSILMDKAPRTQELTILMKRRRSVRAFATTKKVRPPVLPSYVDRHSWYMYTVSVAEEVDRDWVVKELKERGIDTRLSFPPVHTQPYYQSRFGYRNDSLPVTYHAWSKLINFPIWPGLPQDQQYYVIENLLALCKKST